MKQMFIGCLIFGMMAACNNNEKNSETVDTLQDTMIPVPAQPLPDNSNAVMDTTTQLRGDSLKRMDSMP